MVFVDSNVVMYLIGAPHPNRDLLEKYFRENPAQVYVSSVEVYQEVVHRYIAIDRRQAISDAFRLLDSLLHSVFPIHRRDVDRAHEISLAQKRLSGRDCLHVAVMENHGVSRILTLDRGFDLWPPIDRLP